MTLADQDTGMMDTLCQPELVDASLQSSLQEIFDLERQDVIEFHAGLVQHPNPNETANEGVSFKQSLGVFLIECQKLTSRLMLATMYHIRAWRRYVPGSATDLRQCEHNAPHFTLVAKAIFADNLQLRVSDGPSQ